MRISFVVPSCTGSVLGRLFTGRGFEGKRGQGRIGYAGVLRIYVPATCTVASVVLVLVVVAVVSQRNETSLF